MVAVHETNQEWLHGVGRVLLKIKMAKVHHLRHLFDFELAGNDQLKSRNMDAF